MHEGLGVVYIASDLSVSSSEASAFKSDDLDVATVLWTTWMLNLVKCLAALEAFAMWVYSSIVSLKYVLLSLPDIHFVLRSTNYFLYI